MRLWQFGRLQGKKIKIDKELGDPLGLVNGSQVFSTMFRYDYGGASSYEIVLSTFGPENYRQLCQLTIHMIDRPGACAQASKFLADRNVDILNSVSLSTIPGVAMTWRMLADLSYYGEPEELRSEFEAQKKQRPSSLDKVDTLEMSVSRISDRYSKGAAVGSKVVKTKQVKRKQKAPTVIQNDEFELPAEFLAELKDVKDGQPLMLVGDHDSYVLSVTVMDPAAKLASASFVIPDKPGAINRVVDMLAKHGANVVSLYTEVLVYYESMTLDIVVDVSKCDLPLPDLRTALEGVLSQQKGRYWVESMEPIGL
ncbi:hypothetical protein [Methanomassiliicoccus luminyensis]|uniref:hypothetical protein n=1 Tax=Methanomassiliicoccus luminyensis TaxID=1080712 RepID=UPI00035F3D37|nr:hypothetical protein [Methanomassiliicoccus luminyensis]